MRFLSVVFPVICVPAVALVMQAQGSTRPASSDSGRAVISTDGAITVVGKNKGYTGISFGGAPTFGPDGKPRWADYPVIQRLGVDSPGAKAGLVVGDAIISVNGADARAGKILLAKDAGETFAIRVRRGTEFIDVSIISALKPAGVP